MNPNNLSQIYDRNLKTPDFSDILIKIFKGRVFDNDENVLKCLETESSCLLLSYDFSAHYTSWNGRSAKLGIEVKVFKLEEFGFVGSALILEK